MTMSPKPLLLCALLLTGCTSLTVSDDLETNWPDLLSLPQDGLHLPYVVGAPVSISVNETNRGTPFTGWRLESSAPEVFSAGDVESQGYTLNGAQRYWGAVKCHAVSAGKAQLTLRDEKSGAIKQFEVEVLQPDHIDLFPAGWTDMLTLDVVATRPDLIAPTARLVANGTASYLVRYSRAGCTLRGNAALTFGPTSQATFSLGSPVFRKQDFLAIKALGTGTATVPLLVGGVAVRDLTIDAVAPEAVASLRLVLPEEAGAKHDDQLVTLCRAFDAAGEELFGIEPLWDLDGMPQQSYESNTGDLYSYLYSKDVARSLFARVGQLQASAQIHASSGWIRSSNTVTW
jgi:hypothetical protein